MKRRLLLAAVAVLVAAGCVPADPDCRVIVRDATNPPPGYVSCP